jgi:hypothetical protein
MLEIKSEISQLHTADGELLEAFTIFMTFKDKTVNCATSMKCLETLEDIKYNLPNMIQAILDGFSDNIGTQKISNKLNTGR